MMLFPKSPIVRDRKYLDAVRGLPCFVTQRVGQSEPCHLRLLGNGGTGMKPSDDLVLPLHYELHREQTQRGEGAAWVLWAQQYETFYFRLLIQEARRRYGEWKCS